MEKTMNHKLIVFVALSAISSSCTTLFKSETKAVKPHKEVIVQRAGDGDNQVDGKEKEYWVSVNVNAKKASTKMVASLASGDPVSSENYARRQLRKTPANPKALAVLTASLAQQKNFAMAAFYARELLKRDENSSLAMNVIGLSYLMTSNATMQDLRKAHEYFEKSIQMSGGEIAAALNLAYLQLELGRPDLAFESFSLAHKRCDACFFASIGRGIAAYRTGRNDIAKSDFEAILSGDERNGEAMYRLALLTKNGYNDKEQARKLLDRLQNESDADDNLKRRAYVLARKLEDTRSIENIARDDKSDTSPAAEGDMDVLYKALDSE